MSKTTKNLIGAAVALAILVALVFAGLYVGGRAFAVLQKIPSEAVTITTLHDYWLAYGDVKKVKLALFGGIVVAAAVPLLPLVLCTIALVGGPKRSLHGNARFASMAEIRKAGLLDDNDSKWPGVVVAKYADQFVKFAGQSFLMLIAPTRSGKDVGVVNPNLLSYPHSIVDHDIKLESWKKTAGFRAQHGQECFLFAPNHPEQTSHRWNSLSYIRPEYVYRIADIQNISAVWYPGGGKDAFWHDGAQVLFMGLVLYMLETPSEPVAMANLLRLTTPGTGESLNTWIESTIVAREGGQDALPRLSVECVESLRSFSVNTDTVRANILSTFVAPLKIFRNPLIAAATSGDDFDLRDVRRKKMSIYFGMTPEDLVTYSQLANLFYSQLINENTKVLPEDDPTLKYQCLIIFNEFTSLGRVKIIQKAIAYMAGFNMRLLLICQNKSQLAGRDDGYGLEGASTLMTNCAMKIMFQPKENEDAKEYSEMLGYETVKGKSKTRQVGGKTGRSENESDQRRALMLPQEVKEIGFDKLLISVENCKPILADKIIYWNDPAFEGRIGLPPPVVPRLEVVRVGYRLRALTPNESMSVDLNDITNTDEILKAIGESIGFDFSMMEPPAADIDMAFAA